MAGFLKLKILKGHQAGVWGLQWSFYGEFLISCGSDEMVLVWGLNKKIKYKNSISEEIGKFLYFFKWKCLCKFKSFKRFKTHRSVGKSYNRNYFCISTFLGILHSCRIVFFNKNKFVCIEKKISFFNSFYEIKSCKYSCDNCLMLVTTRNKEVWVWKKNKFDFDYFYTLNQHESDIKCLKWCFGYKCFLTTTYEGIFRFFMIYRSILALDGFIVLSNSTIWDLNFTKNEKEIISCTNKGFLIFFIQKKKNYIYFFFLSMTYVFYFSISDHNSCTLYTDNEENINIVFKHKLLFTKKKSFVFYTGICFFFQIKIQNLLKILSSGDINCITWHPNQNNTMASCGDDGIVYIWYYTQFTPLLF